MAEGGDVSANEAPEMWAFDLWPWMVLTMLAAGAIMGATVLAGVMAG